MKQTQATMNHAPGTISRPPWTSFLALGVLLYAAALGLGIAWSAILARVLVARDVSTSALSPVVAASDAWVGIAGAVGLGVFIARRWAPNRLALVVAATLNAVLLAAPVLQLAPLAPRWSWEHLATRTVTLPMDLTTGLVAWGLCMLYTRRVGPQGWLHASVACLVPVFVGWGVMLLSTIAVGQTSLASIGWTLAPALLPVSAAVVATERFRPRGPRWLASAPTTLTAIGLGLVTPAVVNTVITLVIATTAPFSAATVTAPLARVARLIAQAPNIAVLATALIVVLLWRHRTTTTGRLGWASVFVGIWLVTATGALAWSALQGAPITPWDLFGGRWGDAIRY